MYSTSKLILHCEVNYWTSQKFHRYNFEFFKTLNSDWATTVSFTVVRNSPSNKIPSVGVYGQHTMWHLPLRAICFVSLRVLCYWDNEVSIVGLCRSAKVREVNDINVFYLPSFLSQTQDSAGSALTRSHTNFPTSNLGVSSATTTALTNYPKILMSLTLHAF